MHATAPPVLCAGRAARDRGGAQLQGTRRRVGPPAGRLAGGEIVSGALSSELFSVQKGGRGLLDHVRRIATAGVRPPTGHAQRVISPRPMPLGGPGAGTTHKGTPPGKPCLTSAPLRPYLSGPQQSPTAATLDAATLDAGAACRCWVSSFPAAVGGVPGPLQAWNFFFLCASVSPKIPPPSTAAMHVPGRFGTRLLGLDPSSRGGRHDDPRAQLATRPIPRSFPKELRCLSM